MPDTSVSYEIYQYILANYGSDYVDIDGDEYWIALDSLISEFPNDFSIDNGNVYTISQNVSQKGIFIGTL